MTTKMKGLLKGLRYISQIFDEEKEPEMVIGFPTDVKHVAHIGMDGPSNAPPSWMNEFKQTRAEGESNKEESESKTSDGNTFHKASDGSNRRGVKAQCCHGSPARELPEVPKPSRRHSSSSTCTDSPIKAKSEKHRHACRASKGSPGRDFLDPSRLPSDVESESGMDSPRKLPDIPKKTRRKKSKDSDGGSVRKSKATTQASPLSEESGSVPRNHSSSSINSVEEGDVEKGHRAVS